jgi:hypothetical protein
MSSSLPVNDPRTFVLTIFGTSHLLVCTHTKLLTSLRPPLTLFVRGRFPIKVGIWLVVAGVVLVFFGARAVVAGGVVVIVGAEAVVASDIVIGVVAFNCLCVAKVLKRLVLSDVSRLVEGRRSIVTVLFLSTVGCAVDGSVLDREEMSWTTTCFVGRWWVECEYLKSVMWLLLPSVG